MDGSPIGHLTRCLICSHEKDEKLIEVTKKGMETILRFAGNDKLVSECIENVKQTKFTAKVFMHADPKRIKRHVPAEPPESPKRLRSADTVFNWKVNCFLCGTEINIEDNKTPNTSNIQRVETVTIRENIIGQCNKRNDKWGLQIKARLNNCIDLVAAEAFYHKSCHCRFYFNKNNPTTPVADKLAGRPIHENMHETFEKLCQWLEK